MTETSVGPAGQAVNAASPTDGALTGVRVIDLSTVVSGPFATAILADQGADVIMVEQTGAATPVGSHPVRTAETPVTALFASQNRNKRSVAVDLQSEDGKDLVKALVAEADVLVENFGSGEADRLGLGWEVLSAINPDLVMCSITGFGSDGPHAHRPATDAVVQAVAGYMMVQADEQGAPRLVNTIICDKLTSVNVAQSVCAALVARANGAGGQHLDLAMIDAAIHFLWPESMWNYTYLEHQTDMPDLSAIYTLYRSKDGWAMVYPVATEAHWSGMCKALGRPDLAADPRFADLQGRVLYGDEVNEELQAEMLNYTTTELVELMDRADVPAAPVNTREAMMQDSHVQQRGMVVETIQPSLGPLRQARPAALFSRTPSTLRRPAPAFGEHTADVLAELTGRTEQEIAELRALGVIS
jgi:crotonobetainyl-CoA:carnitine CoA-transferase CaiB-like acyl-CoA transferase